MGPLGVFAEFADAFRTRGSRQFLIDAPTGRSFTYGEFLEHSLAAADWLIDQGVVPGDCVLFSCGNSSDLALLYFAAMHAGARIVPVNTQLDARETGHIARSNAPKLILLDPAQAERKHELLPAELVERVRVIAQADEAEDGDVVLAQAVLGLKRRAEPFAHGGDEAVFLTAYSSGSTAAPKGMDVTWRGMLGNGAAYARHMGLDDTCRFINMLPMSYMGGFYNLLVLPAQLGASVVVDEVFGPANLFGFWDTVTDHGVDTLWFTAAMLSMLLAADRGDELAAKIRFAFCGFAPLPVDLKQRFETRFGMTLRENYASSECLFVTANNLAAYKPGSKGTALPGVDLSVVDAELRAVASGQEGQILVRTRYFMAGYRDGKPSDQAQITAGGFLTGDVGVIDAGGELFVTGRVKDLIIRGGINISPAGIEESLCRHPAVDEAAVIGIPDEVYGEEMAAAITLVAGQEAPSEKELKAHCRSELPAYKVPKRIAIIPAMPRGMTGKTDKNAIRRMMIP